MTNDPNPAAAIETRCGDCIAAGIECPRGYFGGRVDCDVCRYAFALSAPGCAPEIACPECGGTVTYEETHEQ